MGKIFNALEKYGKQNPDTSKDKSLTDYDLSVIMKYNRKTNMLNLDTKDIEDPETIDRLVKNNLISPNGKITGKGKKKCEELTYNLRLALSGSSSIDKEKEELSQESIFHANENKITEDDIEFLRKYDRTTEHLLKYDKISNKLSEDSLAILHNSGLLQRLMIGRLITYDGRLTAEGINRSRKNILNYRSGESRDHSDDKIFVTRKNNFEPAREKNDDLFNMGDEGNAFAYENKLKTSEAESDKIIPKTKHQSTILSSKPSSSRKEIRPIDQRLVTLLEENSFEAEQFKILRSNILFPLHGKTPRSILITSMDQGDGKSFVAANLAISAALNINRHVLLMDCDLRNSSIHPMFGFSDVPGLSEYLSGGDPISSLLLKTKIESLSILPAGSIPSNPAELLSSDRMFDLIREVSERYEDRLIIIDSPPPSLTAEAGVIARHVDGILVVVKFGSTRIKDLKKLVETVGKEKIIGSVINHYDYSPIDNYRNRSYRKYGYYKKKGK